MCRDRLLRELPCPALDAGYVGRDPEARVRDDDVGALLVYAVDQCVEVRVGLGHGRRDERGHEDRGAR